MQPAASAGATLQAIWLSGQFHGVIRPHTPMGSFRMSVEPLASSNWKLESTFVISKKWPMPAATCAARDSQSGAPISVDTLSTSSS